MTVKLAQITDTHLLTDREATMRGVATWHSLHRVLDCVAERQPDALLLTGDLAHNGDPAAYDLLYELVAALQIPAYWLPGNHDRPAIAHDRLSRAPFVTGDRVELGDWNLILLDSTLATATYGEGAISVDQLQRLRTHLDNTDRPTAIALHHHPIPMAIDWLDTIGVTNAREFLDLLDQADQADPVDQQGQGEPAIDRATPSVNSAPARSAKNNPVKLVLFGHTHLEFAGDRHGIQFYGTPSTCTQVLREDATEIDTLPGFRWIELHPDGSHHSQVIRVPQTPTAPNVPLASAS
ncbi:MAG: phosphodiesterase [Oscillatoriales cyanobacterium]|nr:MAG: phosphodiesterase [Oscillatoriales cyanobacterium]